MLTTHNLKCYPVPFAAIASGIKTAEFRKEDRPGMPYGIGDRLELWEYDPDTRDYTGCKLSVLVTHRQVGFGIPDGYVMLSIKLLA
jgi:hypothetical protein